MIARGDGTSLYNFAVAVDDAEMGITDVVRGDDHLSNTPKQLLVLERARAPSRRATRTCRCCTGPTARSSPSATAPPRSQELRDAGYLPAAVRNYLALLGWGTDDDTTLMSTEELVERFGIEGVGRSAAIFDEQKLRWLNGRFMRELPLDEYSGGSRSPASGRPGRRVGVRAAPPSGCAPPARSPRRRRRPWPRSGR